VLQARLEICKLVRDATALRCLRVSLRALVGGFAMAPPPLAPPTCHLLVHVLVNAVGLIIIRFARLVAKEAAAACAGCSWG